MISFSYGLASPFKITHFYNYFLKTNSFLGIVPPISHEGLYQDPLKGGMGYESRSPLLNQMPQNYPQPYDTGAKNVTGRFSTSKIEEMSMNFRSINSNLLNQPGGGNPPGPGMQQMGQGPAGFGGFGGLDLDTLQGQTIRSGLGGVGGFRMNEPIGNTMQGSNFPQVLPPQSNTPGIRTENEPQNPQPTQAMGQQPSTQKTPPPQFVSFDSLLKGFDKESTDISEEWKSRVTFSVNNCSNSNIDEKSIEIRGLLNEEHVIKWFAKYIVYQRAPLESNFHSMYINLVNKIGKKEIFTYIIKETYALLNRIIEYDKIFSEAGKAYIQGNDKNNLKNLGSWLGMLTIGRNKPIVMKDFDLKTLIIEAYENQKLDYMLPLVCKILAHGTQANSVFKPKNAWMNALLAILAEITQMPEIKLALKCEVQVLLNNFGLDEGEVTPSKILQTRKMQRRNIQRGSESQDVNEQPIRFVIANETQLTLNELPQYITVDQKHLKILPNLKNSVAKALDEAIK